MGTLILDFWPEARTPGQAAGIRDALAAECGEDSTVIRADVLEDLRGQEALSLLASVLRDHEPRHVIVLASPVRLIEREADFAALCEMLRDRVVTYWEGDGWGRGKPLPAPMRWWMNRADHLFHTGGVPGAEKTASTETRVHFAPNAYCHITFADAEATPPPSWSEFDMVMIGNNVTRSRIPIPGLTGIPGGLDRWRLARQAHMALGSQRFLLLGRDWPAPWTEGSVAFNEQATAIRRARVSVNWDHFPTYPGYSSDRLAIALIAGRPHVTTEHPRMDWCPSPLEGLIRLGERARVFDSARALSEDPAQCRALGLAAWEWSRNRLSTRVWARFILSRIRSDVEPPIQTPWRDLPEPTQGTAPLEFPR